MIAFTRLGPLPPMLFLRRRGNRLGNALEVGGQALDDIEAGDQHDARVRLQIRVLGDGLPKQVELRLDLAHFKLSGCSSAPMPTRSNSFQMAPNQPST